MIIDKSAYIDMAETTIIPVTKEPEEAIEAALCALLASACTIPVEGALTPATNGEVKHLTSDTFVSVMVDQSSQDLDFIGAYVPHTYTATIAVHVALADDANAALFRDECRRVRAALSSISGDSCKDLGAEDFACDSFMVNSTSTNFDGGDNPSNSKAYTATLKGRITNTQTEA